MSPLTLEKFREIRKTVPGFVLENGYWGDSCEGCLVTMLVFAKNGMPINDFVQNIPNADYVTYVAGLYNWPPMYVQGLIRGFDGCYGVYNDINFRKGYMDGKLIAQYLGL